MAPEKPRIEVEIGPRFEIFYALHKTFAPPTALTGKWRRSARSRLGPRVENEARDVAPHPLMWAVLADSTLSAARITSFDDLTGAIEAQPEESFRETILAGVPDVRGVRLAETFDTLLGNPEDYRSRLVAVLRAFWSRVFADDFDALLPELNRLGRQLASAAASATLANAGSRTGIPISLDEESGALIAGRSGYSIPVSRVGRVVLLPSAFNLNRWWTKRESEHADLFFPVSDGTITPNDAVSRSARAAPKATEIELMPEVVFRALGDTTRYAIATILARTPMTPTELARQLRVSKPTITHHVHSLRDAGLIIEGEGGGKLALDRAKLEQLSEAVVSALFSSEGRLKLSRTRKKSS
jgi:DNA-binding transcriptional ArsR family regulator